MLFYFLSGNKYTPFFRIANEKDEEFVLAAIFGVKNGRGWVLCRPLSYCGRRPWKRFSLQGIQGRRPRKRFNLQSIQGRRP